MQSNILVRAALAATLVLPAAARAQADSAAAPAAPAASLATDVTLANAYVWRGVTFTNRPVVQGDAYLTVAAGRGAISGGVWGNAEPRNYDGATDLRLVAAGRSGPAFTAFTTWLDYTRTAGRLAATGGLTSYWYPSVTGAADAYNTSELYGRVALTGPLSPRLALYVDVEKVRGSYVEGSVAAPVALGSHAVSLGATVGASAGQAAARGQSAYFARDGVAFADLSATTTLTTHGLSASPAAHVLLDRDATTRVVDAGGATRRVKAWVGFTLGYARPVPVPGLR